MQTNRIVWLLGLVLIGFSGASTISSASQQGAMTPAQQADDARGRETQKPTALSGGAATVFATSQRAFTLPIPHLSPEQETQFFVGNSFFNRNWVIAPASTQARDGLGPLFNAR